MCPAASDTDFRPLTLTHDASLFFCFWSSNPIANAFNMSFAKPLGPTTEVIYHRNGGRFDRQTSSVQAQRCENVSCQVSSFPKPGFRLRHRCAPPNSLLLRVLW